MPVPHKYHEIILPASRHIEAHWSFVATQTGESIILPDGRCDIIQRWHTDTPQRITHVLTGPATEPYIVHYRAGDIWQGIRLRPAHGRLLWGRDIRTARNQVQRTLDVNPRVPTQRMITAHTPPRPVINALNMIHTTGGRIKIATLAGALHCSARHLNRLMLDHVGLGPKPYTALVQFHRALKLIRNNGLNFSDTAFEAGYSDQAHMSRAFRQFGGFSPAKTPTDISLPGLPI